MKIKRPNNQEYLVAAVALSDITPCRKCGWPVRSGYCCGVCWCSSPSSKDNCQDKECKVCSGNKDE